MFLEDFCFVPPSSSAATPPVHNVWGVCSAIRTPVALPHFRINIVPHPAHLSEDPSRPDLHNHVSAVLDVTYTSEYPSTPPLLRLESAQGLSNSAQTELLKQLRAQTKDLAGNVMVYDLVQSVQEYLRAYNVKSLSFHDEMLERERKEEEEQRRRESEERKRRQFEEKLARVRFVLQICE